MKKFVFILVLLFPIFAFAKLDDEGFILYKRPLLPGFSLDQTADTTDLIYRGEVIKSYKNAEFSIELLPHGPNEEPDCYNSLSRSISSTRVKTLVGTDYLRDCFVMRSDKILNNYLLLYSPSIEGNRVSLYDLKAKKYYHWLLNTVLSYRRHKSGTLVLLTKNSQNLCDRSISVFQASKLTKLIDSCQMSQNTLPVRIHSFRILRDDIIITYSEVSLVGNDYITSKIQKKYILPLPGYSPQSPAL
jgi:hypothetical protein